MLQQLAKTPSERRRARTKWRRNNPGKKLRYKASIYLDGTLTPFEHFSFMMSGDIARTAQKFADEFERQNEILSDMLSTRVPMVVRTGILPASWRLFKSN